MWFIYKKITKDFGNTFAQATHALQKPEDVRNGFLRRRMVNQRGCITTRNEEGEAENAEQKRKFKDLPLLLQNWIRKLASCLGKNLKSKSTINAILLNIHFIQMLKSVVTHFWGWISSALAFPVTWIQLWIGHQIETTPFKCQVNSLAEEIELSFPMFQINYFCSFVTPRGVFWTRRNFLDNNLPLLIALSRVLHLVLLSSLAVFFVSLFPTRPRSN